MPLIEKMSLAPLVFTCLIYWYFITNFICLDPYFEISLNPPGTRPIVLYRSEFVSKNLSPTWQPVEISLLDIGNPYFPISVTVYDSDKNGSHDLIGSCTLTLDECILGSLTLPLINPSKKNK